ncbi:hypothetical protein ACRQEO_07575, partial [Actinotignum sp. GS-2025b]|uniref:hypothetical protein n=1 Tax=Actinotignum sp. GS-2025b TaxID=3427275 RepID=UPI003F488B41
MKVTKTIRSTIVGVCVLALSLSTVVTANAAEQDKVETLSNSTTTHSVSEQNYIPFNEQELTDGLNLIRGCGLFIGHYRLKPLDDAPQSLNHRT